MNVHHNECAVLIASCNAYSDAWMPFFTQFFKYWPDCPFPVYVVTDSGSYPDPRVNVIELHEDRGWTDNVLAALDLIKTPYVLYILDDVPLMRPVETKRLLRAFDIMKKEKAAYLRLYPSPGPDAPFKEYNDVGLIAPEARYRTSTMAAIWDVEALRAILKPGENAWQFELLGTDRSRNYPRPFLSLWPKDGAVIDHFATAIKKGRWQWDAVRFLKKEGIEIDPTRRRVETFIEYVIRKAEGVRLFNPFIRRIRYAFGAKKPAKTAK